MDSLQQLGLNIRVRRVKLGMTQEQLAVEAGVERSYMGAIERGERNLSVLILLKVCKALECSPGLLFEDVVS